MVRLEFEKKGVVTVTMPFFSNYFVMGHTKKFIEVELLLFIATSIPSLLDNTPVSV